MKPQDVIKQLIGDCDGMDVQDTMAYSFSNPSKFPDWANADIDFERGILTLQKFGQMEDGHADVVEERMFAIKATLEEINYPGIHGFPVE